MLKLLCCCLLLGCATTRPINPDGTPAPLPSEMKAGEQRCRELCAEVDMSFREYRADGKCICTQVSTL